MARNPFRWIGKSLKRGRTTTTTPETDDQAYSKLRHFLDQRGPRAPRLQHTYDQIQRSGGQHGAFGKPGPLPSYARLDMHGSSGQHGPQSDHDNAVYHQPHGSHASIPIYEEVDQQHGLLGASGPEMELAPPIPERSEDYLEESEESFLNRLEQKHEQFLHNLTEKQDKFLESILLLLEQSLKGYKRSQTTQPVVASKPPGQVSIGEGLPSHGAEAQVAKNWNAKKFIAHLMRMWKIIFQRVF